jgi:MFS family permease
VNAIFHSGVFTWLGVYFSRRHGLGEVGIGLALLGYGVPGFLLGPIIGRAADRCGRRWLIPSGLAIGGLAAAALMPDMPLVLAALAVTVLSLGYDMTQPLLAGIVTALGGRRGGQAMGLNVLTLFTGFGIGLARVERDGDVNEYASPLLRLNLGLPRNVEVVSEFEYRADEGEVGDAAMGFKWVPFLSALSVGVETLALLPVSTDASGTGVESLLLATWRERALRVHVNAGGFYDARPEDAESGWKAGSIVELRLARLRPGVEVFAKQQRGEPAQVFAGPGLILNFGAFDVRVGLHVGLTEEAPDLVPELWVTTKLPLRSTVSDPQPITGPACPSLP